MAAKEPDNDKGTDRGSKRPPFAVILGGRSQIGRHLVRHLSERGFEGICLSRRAVPEAAGLPTGFTWGVTGGDASIDLPETALVFSLVPIPALPDALGGSRAGSGCWR